MNFLRAYPRYPKTPELKATLPGKFRNRGTETGNALDFLAAHKLTNDRGDIQAAQKHAKDDHAKAEVEGTLVSGFPNKHKLVTAASITTTSKDHVRLKAQTSSS